MLELLLLSKSLYICKQDLARDASKGVLELCGKLDDGDVAKDGRRQGQSRHVACPVKTSFMQTAVELKR